MYGPKWDDMASLIPGRTYTSCRNRFQRMMANLKKHGVIVDGRDPDYRGKNTTNTTPKPEKRKTTRKTTRKTNDSKDTNYSEVYARYADWFAELFTNLCLDDLDVLTSGDMRFHVEVDMLLRLPQRLPQPCRRPLVAPPPPA